jgi:hypothetical protein
MTVSPTSSLHPRRLSTGRLITGVTLVAIGGLWLLETAGVGDVDWFWVMPAVLGLMGLAMIAGVGGRSANGMIPLGFFLIAVMFFGTLTWPTTRLHASVGNRTYTPSTSAGMRSEYGHGMGNLELDLRRVNLEESRNIRASVGMGQLVVRVPQGLPVDIRASAVMGDVNILGEERGGVGPELRYRSRGAGEGAGDGVLTLDLSVGMGSVEVRP